MVVSLAIYELTATDTKMRRMGAAIHDDAFRTENIVNNSAFPFIIDYAPAAHLDFRGARRPEKRKSRSLTPSRNGGALGSG